MYQTPNTDTPQNLFEDPEQLAANGYSLDPEAAAELAVESLDKLSEEVLADDELAQLEPESTPAKKGRSREITKISTVDEDGNPKSIYTCLVEYGLLRKMTDIVLAKVAVPWHLRADASQEIHCTWAGLKAKPTFARNQLANYAYLSGKHSALKLRRTVGAVVVIPGALFRNGRDSPFMESIGAAVNPKDVDDYKDSLELSVVMPDNMSSVRVSDQLYAEKMADLGLSAKQTAVAERAVLKRMPVDDIATELQMQVSAVERILNQITAKLHASEDAKRAASKEPAGTASVPQKNKAG